MNPTKRIALILTVIFLIPALFFSVYEISSLNKDEKIIEEIYRKQLEAILFSVNQYSDDALNSWISKVEAGIANEQKGEVPPAIQNLLLLNSYIQQVVLVDTIDQKPSLRVFSADSVPKDSIKMAVNKSLAQSKDKIAQLIKYKKSGFQKSEIIEHDWKGHENLELVIFIADGRQHRVIAGLLIDPAAFIEEFVGPRLQTISKDQFILSAFDKPTNQRIYCTLPGDTTSLASYMLNKDFWIFPDYSIGIQTRGASLKQIVEERTSTNLMLLIGLDVVLIVALVLAFRSVKREVQLAQNKSDFVSNVSHEIRTPLALISMFAETLEMGRVKTEEKKQEYYGIINKETQRLSKIVNKILNFSQTESGKKTLHIEPVLLTREIEEVLNTYDFHLKNKGFEFAYEKSQDLLVKADKEAFTEIIINLLDNAIKYSEGTKRIEISQGIDGTFGWVAIRDYGLGISPGDQKHIFDKFYRVSSGNLAKSQGTGLGLSLVKQLMEQQSGKISVISGLGKGSTFTLHFPLA